MSLRLHIGFDFWGAGNLGDDLMLAGFLGWMQTHCPEVEISALCAHDIAAMRRRFPEITWHAADPASRAAALATADAWIGLGGGVFQIEVGTWILDQMAENMSAAKARGIPRFLVGIGVNNRDALHTPQAATVRALADRIWLRDATCLEMALAAGFSAENTLIGADTAHLAFAGPRPARTRQEAAFVLHVDERALSPSVIAHTVERIPLRWHWACQESRALADSEMKLYDLLPAELRARMPLAHVDYAHATVEDLAAHATRWDLVLSARYHTTLASAWAGSRVAVFERNQKLTAVRADLQVESCRSLDSADEMVRALEAAQPVRPAILAQCHARASDMLASLIARVRFP